MSFSKVDCSELPKSTAATGIVVVRASGCGHLRRVMRELAPLWLPAFLPPAAPEQLLSIRPEGASWVHVAIERLASDAEFGAKLADIRAGPASWLSRGHQHGAADRQIKADCRRCPSEVSRWPPPIESQRKAWDADAGIPTQSCQYVLLCRTATHSSCHDRQMANHASTRTTQLYPPPARDIPPRRGGAHQGVRLARGPDGQLSGDMEN